MAAAATSTAGTGIIEALSNNVNVVGGLWVASSALLTTYSTTKFLKYSHDDGLKAPLTLPLTRKKRSISLRLPRAALLTLYRFSGSLLLGLLLHPDLQIMARIKTTSSAIPDFTLPATFLFIANYANSLALNRIGISLTYTSKCAIPIFTMLLTLILDGPSALPSVPALLSLVPIAAGIAAASWDSPVFELQGFLYAMLSCTAQTGLNIMSKKSMARTGLSGPQGQRAMVAVALVITITVFLLKNISSREDSAEETRSPPAWLSLMALVAYHMEYIMSFTFVRLVQPVTYGACDAVRRLSIIISGHYMFGNDTSFSRTNITGIATAIFGALCYAVTSHAPKP
jgi:hypothetical protein